MPPSEPPRVEPPKRSYIRPRHDGPPERDAAELPLHVMPLIIGAGIGFIWAPYLHLPRLISIPLFAGAVWGLTRPVVVLGSRWFLRATVAPTGETTPRRREYSFPESLAARGRWREAAEAYEEIVRGGSIDPEPFLRIAWLYKDQLNEPERAVEWLKRVRREVPMGRGQELAVTQEIVEIYKTRLGEPRRAIPELARMAERFADLPAGEWARRRLEELRAELRADGVE